MEISLRCFYMFLQSHLICRIYQRWTLREFPVYYFLPFYSFRLYSFSFNSLSLSLSLSHIYLNNFFTILWRATYVYLTTKGCGLYVVVWFLCESRTARVNRKLLTGPTKNVVFTVSSNDTFFFFELMKSSFDLGKGLRRESEMNFLTGRRWCLNKMNRRFVENRKSYNKHNYP